VTFVPIHGGGDVGWSWHLVDAELRVHGHEVVAPYVRRVAHKRLGITPDEIDSGHTPALSHPTELAARLLSYEED
jgi:hypothetical protein